MKYILNETQYRFYKKILEEERLINDNLTSTQKKLIKIADSVQKGYMSFDDLENFIGGFEILLKRMSDQGVLNYIDPFDPMWEDYQNDVFYAFYQNDTSFIWKIVDKYLADVVEENGKYYFTADPDDLARFFNTSWRSEIGTDGIENIISGEHDYDHFYEVTDDEYRDVYDNLNEKNKKLVNEVIKKDLLELGKLDVTSKTPSLFDEIAKEQGHEDYIELTSEIIDRLLGDENCVEYIIMEESDDLKQNLYNIYSDCYSNVIRDSWYHDIMNKLEGYIIDNSKRLSYTYEKRVYDKQGDPVMKKMYGEKYEATNCIYEVVSEWLEQNKGYNNKTIDYFSSYKELFQNLIDDGWRETLRVPRLDEYPDHREVVKCVNENFGDYF